MPKISYFHGSRATIRKSNGTLLTASVSQYPQVPASCANDSDRAEHARGQVVDDGRRGVLWVD